MQGRRAKANAMTLAWTGLETLPSDLHLTLVDEVKGKSMDMRNRKLKGKYKIKAGKGLTQYRLRVVMQ